MSTSTSTPRDGRCLRAALLCLALLPGGAARAANAQAEALAKQGQELAEQSCASDGYDEKGCAQARELLERATQMDTGLSEAKLALARATWNGAFTKRQGDPQREELKQKGLKQYQALVDSNVKDARPYLELGRLTRDGSARAPLLEKAVKLDPKNAEAVRRLSETYLELGRVDEAVHAYQAGMARQPKLGAEEAAQHVQLGKKLEALGREQDAAWVFDNALSAASGESREGRCRLAEPVKTQRYARFGELTQKLESLRSFCPQETPFRDRAATLEQEGKPEEAVAELKKQIQATPKHEESYLTAQRLLVEQGKPDEAAKVAGQLLTVEKDSGEKCRLLARLHPRAVQALDPETVKPLQTKCAAKP